MNENQKDYISDLEKTIKNIVSDIKDSRDYQNIKNSASDLGGRIINEVNQSVHNAKQTYADFSEYQKSKHSENPAYVPKYNINSKNGKVPTQSVGGILLTVFGSIFLALGFISALVMLILLLITSLAVFLRILLTMLIIGSVGAVMLSIGISKINRISRFKKYKKQFYGREFISVKDLGKTVEKNADAVYEDLKLMLEKQYIEKALFDENKEYVFFSDEVYNQYLEARDKQNRERVEEAKRREAQQSSQVINDGWQYLDELKKIVPSVENDDIRVKAEGLCSITQKIMECITNAPEDADSIKKFSSYYLPSTVNILKTYMSFEQQKLSGDAILRTRDEIANMLDVSNHAFIKVLNSLYDDDVMDVSTDIAAMKAMMAQEGLIDSFDVNMK